MAPSRGARYAPVASDGVGSGPLIMEHSKQCSLWLQVMLYYSFWYDILFAALLLIVAWVKFRWLKGEIVFAFLGANFFIVFVLEPCRLYLGYAGNLRERVPELFLFVFVCFVCYAAFGAQLMLTTVLSAELPELSPKECSTIEGQACILPIEQASWMVRVVLLIVEQILGIRALRRLIKEQSARFFVSLEASVGSAAMSEGAGPDDDLDMTGIMEQPGNTGGAIGRTGVGAREGVQPRSASLVGAGSTSRSMAGSTAPQVYGRQLFSPAEQSGRRPHMD